MSVGVTPKYEYMDQYGNKLDPDRIINPGEYTVTVTFTVDGNHNPIQSKTVKLIVKDTGAAPTANNGLGGLEIALIVICLCLALLVAIIALVIAFKRRNGGDDGDGFYDNITVDDLK